MAATAPVTRTEPPDRRAGAPTPPVAPVKRLRVPQLAVGALVVATMALGFVVWNAASVERVPVVALAADVTRGHVLGAEDLRVVHVGTDDALAVTSADEAGPLIGRAAVGDLPAGTLVVAEQFVSASTLTEGAGVVGLALGPGQYPTPQLRIGDLVNIVVASADHPDGRLLVEAAEVVWVEPVGTQGRRFISVLAGEAQAGQVAAAAAREEVRLVQVARDDRGPQTGGEPEADR